MKNVNFPRPDIILCCCYYSILKIRFIYWLFDSFIILKCSETLLWMYFAKLTYRHPIPKSVQPKTVQKYIHRPNLSAFAIVSWSRIFSDCLSACMSVFLWGCTAWFWSLFSLLSKVLNLSHLFGNPAAREERNINTRARISQ